jgi:three-Cys-motif partner protein
MPRQYTVIDLNAGPGLYLLDNGELVQGTPLNVLRRLAQSQLDWRAAFIEQDPEKAEHLRHWLDEEASSLNVQPSRYTMLTGRHERVLIPWVRKAVPANVAMGLLIHDPNGAPKLSFLEQLTHDRQLRRFDVAVYVQATSLKRTLKLPKEAYNTEAWRPLDEALRRVKANWVVRKPRGSNQYALCIGSNGPLGADWRRMEFWASDSDRGRVILEQLTFTRRELEHLHLQPLFGDP